MNRDDLLDFLNVEEIITVSREQLAEELDAVLKMVDEGCSPILIIADGKPDLLLFSWEDYKRRFSMIHSLEEFECMENTFREFKEEV